MNVSRNEMPVLTTQRVELGDPPFLPIAQEYRQNRHRLFFRLVVTKDRG
jgi:hypothetical protein